MARLPAGAFDRIAALPMRDERALRCGVERIGEGVAARREAQPVETLALPFHLPFVDPCGEGLRDDARLPDAAARETLGRMMRLRRRHGGVRHPQLRGRPALAVFRREGGAKQRPLRAVAFSVGALQRGGEIPPLDAKVLVGAMIARKDERAPRIGQREARGVGAEAGEAGGLRGGGRREDLRRQHLRRQRQREERPNVHRRTLSTAAPA